MSLIIDPAPVVTLNVEGETGRFPVNNLYCVGRNYADHAIEMGSDPNREPPFFFMKPAYAVLQGDQMIYPAYSSDVHHEVELVVAIGAGEGPVSPENAMDRVFGYAVGVDMTRRDLQAEAKEQSRPWDAGKSFLHAAPVSSVVPASSLTDMTSGRIALSVNGELRQEGDLNQMIWKVPETIARLSTLFYLQPGDLIFTGTPAGVGPVVVGDQVEAMIEQLPPLTFTVCSA